MCLPSLYTNPETALKQFCERTQEPPFIPGSMNTSGWDVVSSLSLAIANAQLAKNATLNEAAFDFKSQPDPTTTIVVAGHFALWQLVTGGSGQVVKLDVTLADGNLTIATAAGTVASLALAGVVVTLEVPLSFVTGANGSTQELRFDFSTTGKVASQETVLVIPTGSTINPLYTAMVRNAIAECVYNNPASSAHVFATLVPGGNLPSINGPTGGGIQPDHMSLGPFPFIPINEGLYDYNFPLIDNYAFQYTVSAGNSGTDYLTIFSMAQIPGDQTPAVTSLIDSSLVDFVSPACLGLSARYFLKYVLMPQLPAAYGLRPGTSSNGLFIQSPDIGRFHYQNDQITITDIIGLPSVSVNGISYDVQINHMTFSIVDTKLKTELDGESDITSGVSVQFSYTSLSEPGLVDDQLVFAPDPNPSTNHTLGMSDTAKFENILSADLFNVIGNAVGDSIAHSINNNLESFGVSQLNPQFVKWNNYSIGTPTTAGLNDVFYMRGADANANTNANAAFLDVYFPGTLGIPFPG